MSEITDSLNGRPKEPTIAQSGPGLPGDSSQLIAPSKEEAELIGAKLEDAARARMENQEQIENSLRGSA